MKRGGYIQRHAPLRRGKPIRKKAPRRLKTAQNDTARRRWVRGLPCISCGRAPTEDYPSQPAHMTLGPNEKGTSLKTNDDHVVAMCDDCHVAWDQHRGWYAGWPKERRWAKAAVWVAETQLAATPQHYDHAVSLERIGLGRIARGGPAGWSWIPGPAREAA